MRWPTSRSTVAARGSHSSATRWLSPEAGTRGSNHHIVVVDLSLHGIGFSSDERLDPEAVHWMVLDAGGFAQRPVRIASCRPSLNGNGGFECGAEFFLNRRPRFHEISILN